MPLSMVKPFMPSFNKQRYSNIFNIHATDRNKCRIYIPITTGSIPKSTSLQIDPELEAALQAKGFTVSDYKVGLAVGKDGKRQMKIGKLISDQPDLLKRFVNDPQRSTSKSVPGWVVISRHPYDIVGMSFDRGWTSCMEVGKGIHQDSLREDVKHGTLVAYLIKNNDKNINAPISRIAIKPYTNGSHLALGRGIEYGAASRAFTSIVDKFCAWANSGSPAGVYSLAKWLYDDNQPRVYLGLGNGLELFSLDQEDLIDLATNPTTEEEILEQIAGSGDSDLRCAVAENAALSDVLFHRLSNDSSPSVKISVASNGSCPPALLTLLSKLDEPRLLRAVAANPSTPTVTLEELSKGEDESVLVEVAGNKNTSPVVREVLSRHKESYVRFKVARCSYTDLDILTRLSTDGEKGVKAGVAGNTMASIDLLEMLAKDPNSEVRLQVARNRTTPLHVLQLLGRDVNKGVSLAACSHPGYKED